MGGIEACLLLAHVHSPNQTIFENQGDMTSGNINLNQFSIFNFQFSIEKTTAQVYFQLSYFLDERKISFLQIAAAKGCKEACYWYNKILKK